MDEIVKVPPKAAEKIARRVLRHIDYDDIAEKVKSMIPTPQDGKNLVMTEALRADVIDSAAKLVPAGKPGEPGKDGRDGSDYILTRADRETIAAKVRADMDNPSIEEIVNRVVNELDQQGFLVSSSVFQARMDAVRVDVRKKILNAGISGKDMVEEITKFLGSNELITSLDNVTIIKTGTSNALSTDKNKTIEFQNGVVDIFYIIPADDDFSIGSWMVLRKTGTGDVTIQKSLGVTFRGVFGNANFKISGGDGYSAYITKTAANEWLYSGAVKET